MHVVRGVWMSDSCIITGFLWACFVWSVGWGNGLQSGGADDDEGGERDRETTGGGEGVEVGCAAAEQRSLAAQSECIVK
jgi:hypothetical protein